MTSMSSSVSPYNRPKPRWLWSDIEIERHLLILQDRHVQRNTEPDTLALRLERRVRYIHLCCIISPCSCCKSWWRCNWVSLDQLYVFQILCQIFHTSCPQFSGLRSSKTAVVVIRRCMTCIALLLARISKFWLTDFISMNDWPEF